MGYSTELKNYQNEQHKFRIRLMILVLVVVCAFSALAARFYYLQVYRYDYYQTLAENNRISIVPITPNRGLISDRNGIILAHNFFVYTLEITPAKTDNLEETIEELGELVEISASDLKRFKKLKAQSHTFESIPIRTHLNEYEAAKFAVNRFRFPGVELKSRLFRHYPYGTLGTHAIGYISRINEHDLKDLKENNQLSNYKGTEHIGKAGVEQAYEQELHGVTGFQQVEIDADGRAVRVLSSASPTSGNNIVLSIDAKLQEIAEQEFAGRRGALVAIQPTTGEVLAMVSMPSFDANLFVDGIDYDNWNNLNNSLDKPLINRSLKGIYPPGSTFKPFVAMAGLESGKRQPPFTISDPGFFMLPNSHHRYRDWKPTGHGAVDMRKAITVSCDTFFYGLAMELGIDRLTDFVRHFGFGEKTNIDIQGELSGLLPTPAWKHKRFKQPWYMGETVIVGIGQGYTLVTPIQLAHATAMLANRGKAIRPHLVNAIVNAKTNAVKILPHTVADQLELNPDNLEIVKLGMMDVTQPGGTAAFVGAGAGYTIAAKTGTAQVVGIKQNEKYNEHAINERHRDHAWFIAYAPADDPKIAIAVIVENGGHGGSAAGPIARKAMDYYLLGKVPVPQMSEPAETNNPTLNAQPEEEEHD